MRRRQSGTFLISLAAVFMGAVFVRPGWAGWAAQPASPGELEGPAGATRTKYLVYGGSRRA